MNLVLAQKMAQPTIPAEVIQKLNFIAAARAVAGAARGARAGVRNFASGARLGVARARAAGSRVGAGLRAGYGYGRALGSRRPLSEMTPAVRAAFERSYNSGARASLGVGLIAGHRVRRTANGLSAGRVWVRNAAVAGGGFWRRLRGGKQTPAQLAQLRSRTRDLVEHTPDSVRARIDAGRRARGL